MSNYVLVHGAWHGGWCWSRVVPVLAAAGHAVYTPTLSGLGERAHLASPEIGLETHVADVLGTMRWENLNDVVLVGHSYAGVVITAAAAADPDRRISRLVYLDAVVPRNGQGLHDCVPATLKARFEEAALAAGDGWRIPVSVASAAFLGLIHQSDIDWVLPRLVPQPIRCFREAVRLDTGRPAVPRTYINCIGDKAPGQPRTRQAEGIDDYHELRTGHDAMVTAPGDVAALLLAAGR